MCNNGWDTSLKCFRRRLLSTRLIEKEKIRSHVDQIILSKRKKQPLHCIGSGLDDCTNMLFKAV